MSLDIIILILIAFFLILKLLSVLGRKSGLETPSFVGCRGCASAQYENIKDVEIDINKITDPPLRLKALDPTFKMERFLEDAKKAYKAILNAYAQGNTQMLSGLLNIDMMRKFAYEITKREEKYHHCEISVLKIKEANVKEISFENDYTADLKVLFNAEIINYISGKGNKVESGHKSKVENKQDVWTFSKNLRSSDPVWRVVEVNKLFV